MARQPPARLAADLRRGPPCGTGQQLEIRDRLADHEVRAQAGVPLRAPAFPFRDPPQRPQQQLFLAPGNPRQRAVHSRGAGDEGEPRRGDGAPPQGRPAQHRGPGVPETKCRADRSSGRTGRKAAGHARARAGRFAQPLPHASPGPARRRYEAPADPLRAARHPAPAATPFLRGGIRPVTARPPAHDGKDLEQGGPAIVRRAGVQHGAGGFR